MNIGSNSQFKPWKFNNGGEPGIPTKGNEENKNGSLEAKFKALDVTPTDLQDRFKKIDEGKQ